MGWQIWAVIYLLRLEALKQRLKTTLKAREKIQEPAVAQPLPSLSPQKFLQLNFFWTLRPCAFLAS